MKTYFVADTHFCNGTGPFFKNHDKYMRFLDRVGDDRIVKLGDSFDYWRWSEEEIMNGPNKDIIERETKKENIDLIPGNHDLDLVALRKVYQKNIYMSLIVEGWFCIHGHQLDSKLDHPREREIVKKVSLIIQRIDNSLLNKFRDWATSGVRSNAEYKTKFMGVKLAMGHTHVPEVRPTYLNPGSWTGNDCFAILIGEGLVPTLIPIR